MHWFSLMVTKFDWHRFVVSCAYRRRPPSIRPFNPGHYLILLPRRTPLNTT